MDANLRRQCPTPIAEIGLCRRIRSDNGERSSVEAIKFRPWMIAPP